MKAAKQLRTCSEGHKYLKSSDCPVCEQERLVKDSFLSMLSAPARRALENNGITSLEALSKFSKKDLLAFHGLGKSSIPKIEAALQAKGLSLKAD